MLCVCVYFCMMLDVILLCAVFESISESHMLYIRLFPMGFIFLFFISIVVVISAAVYIVTDCCIASSNWCTYKHIIWKFTINLCVWIDHLFANFCNAISLLSGSRSFLADYLRFILFDWVRVKTQAMCL